MLRKLPMIVILGSTGTGKTKLSIELAERFGGEIISADSMQVYADLDVVTAKATREEQNRVRHHMLDVAQPADTFTVVQFRNAALPIINDLLAKSTIPIVVGGTNYYIESLIWDVLVSPLQCSPPTSPRAETSAEKTASNLQSASFLPTPSHDSDVTATPSSLAAEAIEAFTPPNNELDSVSTGQLYDRLKVIDPESAERLHPNNRRKILRALEVHDQSGGIKLSSILKEQRNKPGGNRLGGPIRYPHTILFWLQCSQDILNERLDKRVDSMLKEGLLDEVRNFYEKKIKHLSGYQYTKGVLQTIGFKEFVPYLEKYNTDHDAAIKCYLEENSFCLPKELPLNTAPEGTELLRSCLDELKLVTRRYSKKQLKWINNRFLASKDRQVPQLYALDTSDVSNWNLNVYQPAMDVVDSYMNNRLPKLNSLQRRPHPAADMNEEVSNYCDICGRHFIGEFQWRLHLKSNKHKRAKEGQRKRIKLDKDSLNIK